MQRKRERKGGSERWTSDEAAETLADGRDGWSACAVTQERANERTDGGRRTEDGGTE